MEQVLLEIKNVTKRYVGDGGMIKNALNDVSLSIHRGEVVGLLGINGAGKTTLSSIIATLHRPTSGDLLVEGRSIYTNVNRYRQMIGYCPQSPNLNPHLTLADNLWFAGMFYRVPHKQLVAKIAQVVEEFELGAYLKEKVDVLSGGYRQRFMLARTLLHNPALIILDEPTVGLDPHVRHQLWEKIRDLKNEGVSVLLTTHYLDEAELLSDRVCILDQGQVKLVGVPEELLVTYQKSRLEEVFLQLIHQEAAVPKHVRTADNGVGE